MNEENRSIVNTAELAHLIDSEFKRLGWSNREAGEKSEAVALKYGYARRWGKGLYAGISYTAWQTLRTGTTGGVPDLEVLALAALTLREYGSTITLGQILTAMGLDVTGGEAMRQTGAHRLAALPEEMIERLLVLTSLRPDQLKIIFVLAEALQHQGEDQ